MRNASRKCCHSHTHTHINRNELTLTGFSAKMFWCGRCEWNETRTQQLLIIFNNLPSFSCMPCSIYDSATLTTQHKYSSQSIHFEESGAKQGERESKRNGKKLRNAQKLNRKEKRYHHIIAYFDGNQAIYTFCFHPNILSGDAWDLTATCTSNNNTGKKCQIKLLKTACRNFCGDYMLVDTVLFNSFFLSLSPCSLCESA